MKMANPQWLFFQLSFKKLSLCHGVFDILHYGIYMLIEAKRHIGILVVSLTTDKHV